MLGAPGPAQAGGSGGAPEGVPSPGSLPGAAAWRRRGRAPPWAGSRCRSSRPSPSRASPPAAGRETEAQGVAGGRGARKRGHPNPQPQAQRQALGERGDGWGGDTGAVGDGGRGWRWGSGDPRGHGDGWRWGSGRGAWGPPGLEGPGRGAGGAAPHLGVGAAVGDVLGVSPLGAPGAGFLEHLLGALGDPGLTLLQAPVAGGPGGAQAAQPPPHNPTLGRRQEAVALTAPRSARPWVPRPALGSPPAWGTVAPCAGTSAASGSAGTREQLGTWWGHGMGDMGTVKEGMEDVGGDGDTVGTRHGEYGDSQGEDGGHGRGWGHRKGTREEMGTWWGTWWEQDMGVMGTMGRGCGTQEGMGTQWGHSIGRDMETVREGMGTRGGMGTREGMGTQHGGVQGQSERGWGHKKGWGHGGDTAQGLWGQWGGDRDTGGDGDTGTLEVAERGQSCNRDTGGCPGLGTPRRGQAWAGDAGGGMGLGWGQEGPRGGDSGGVLAVSPPAPPAWPGASWPCSAGSTP